MVDHIILRSCNIYTNIMYNLKESFSNINPRIYFGFHLNLKNILSEIGVREKKCWGDNRQDSSMGVNLRIKPLTNVYD